MDKKLFPDKTRTSSTPSNLNADPYTYLNDSNRAEAERIRTFMNRAFDNYPDSDKDEMYSRLTKKYKQANIHNFNSAVFELILHELLLCLNCKVLVHPILDNESIKRPDFLVTTNLGDEFYLEARLASEFDNDLKQGESAYQYILDSINSSLTSNKYFLNVSIYNVNRKTQPNIKKLIQSLGEWLKELSTGANIPEKYNWEEKQWHIVFKAIPKTPNEEKVRIIGSITPAATWGNTTDPLRSAIADKTKKYGELGKPYMIAINMENSSMSRIDEIAALFGDEQFFYQDNEQRMVRKPNGSLYGITNEKMIAPKNTNVSGVWVFDTLNLWNIHIKKANLYLHPFAKKPLPEAFYKNILHAKINNDKLEFFNEDFSISECLMY